MPNDPLGWSNSRRQSPYNERFYFLHQRFVEVHFLAVGLVVALHTVPTFRSVRNKLFLVVNLTDITTPFYCQTIDTALNLSWRGCPFSSHDNPTQQNPHFSKTAYRVNLRRCQECKVASSEELALFAKDLELP